MTVGMAVGVAVRMTIRMTVCMTIRLFTLQCSEIMMSFAEHPDREGQFEVRVSDGDGFVEDTFKSFLSPRAILHHDQISILVF